MRTPFNFRIAMDERAARRRWAAYAATALVLTAVFVAGFTAVYVNSYNVMHTEPMTVFEVCGDGVIFLNHFFAL